MSHENKMTNLVLKNKENSAKTQFASFSFFLFFYFFIIEIKKKKTPRMKCMNVMQCNSQRQKKINTKTKEQRTMVTKEKQ